MSEQKDPWRIDPSQVQHVRKVGEGGFAVIYESKLAGVDGLVAAKQLRGITTLTRAAERDFRNEITTMYKLTHPNILKIHGACIASHKNMILMELMEGSLQDLIDATYDTRLSWGDRIHILLQVASALTYLHSQKVIHRDIKAANVLLDKKLTPKLTDFGFAITKTSTSQSTIKSKQSVGTVAWMAPESFSGLSSEKTDAWGFGCLATELIAYATPFHGRFANSDQLAAYLTSGKDAVDSGISSVADCPKELRQIVSACFVRDPAGRPTMAQITAKLATLSLAHAPSSRTARQLDSIVSEVRKNHNRAVEEAFAAGNAAAAAAGHDDDLGAVHGPGHVEEEEAIVGPSVLAKPAPPAVSGIVGPLGSLAGAAAAQGGVGADAALREMEDLRRKLQAMTVEMALRDDKIHAEMKQAEELRQREAAAKAQALAAAARAKAEAERVKAEAEQAKIKAEQQSIEAERAKLEAERARLEAERVQAEAAAAAAAEQQRRQQAAAQSSSSYYYSSPAPSYSPAPVYNNYNTSTSSSSYTSSSYSAPRVTSTARASPFGDSYSGRNHVSGGSMNGSAIYTGSRGGQYYVNSNGNKTYVKR